MKGKTLLTATLLISGSGLVLGAGTLPYAQKFSSNLGDMTVVNVEDGSPTFTFTSYYGKDWGGGVQYIGNANYEADDYLLTPEFAAEAGKVYTVSIEYKGNTKSNIIKLVALVDGTYQSITADKEAKENVWTAFSGKFMATKSGNVKFGLAITSTAGLGTIYFDNFEVSAGISAAAPEAVTEATATPAVADDNFVVNITAKAPVKSYSGEPLAGKVDLSIVRADGVEVFSQKGMTPGAEITATDKAPLSEATTYTFRASNAAGSAPEATAECTPVFSTPKAVSNLQVTKESNGKISISWDAVTEATSENGVFIPSKVLYTVQRNGSTKVVVADKQAATTFTDTYPMPEKGQDAVSYTVIAHSFSRSSASTVSKSVLVGNPYSGEYAESFAKYSFNTKTWTIQDNQTTVWQTTSSSYTPSCSPQDGDEGMLKVQNTGSKNVWIASPVINVKSLKNPRIDFYVYQDNTTSYTNSIIPMVRVNGTDTALGEAVAINGGTGKGWNKYSYYVPANAKAEDFQIVFDATPGAYAALCIDNISVKDILDNDLAVDALEVPANLNIGENVDLTATIHNKGSKTASGYKVKFSINGAELATVDGTELASDARTDVVLPFSVTPALASKSVKFAAEIEWSADENTADNSLEATAEVGTNDYPKPLALTATTSDNSSVQLKWQHPEISTESTVENVTESFENWATGATTAEQGWLYIDGDNAPVKGINGVNANKPQAASVIENGTYNTAHTGTKMLGVSAPYNYRDTNDDWIISPEVTGGQTVKFFAAGYSSFGYVYSTNTYSICYSTGGTAATDFVELKSVNINTKNWTETSFELPANATRFAIHVTKIGDHGILFDDFSFVKGSKPLELKGYNVYRNDVKIASTAADAAAYSDENAGENLTDNEYTVSAVYDRGESLTAGPVKPIITGVENNISDGRAVVAVDGGIIFSGFNNATAAVFDMAGRVVATAVVADGTEINLASGIYVVVVDGTRTKIAVK